MFPLYTGLSCIPTNDPTSGNCTQGTYPVYVVDARKTSDIQHAVNFARDHNVRLVIKNTGHDFAGKSAGFASLSIRTHHLKDITFVEHYSDGSTPYSGPALKASAGAQSRDVYAAAREHGVMVVGGEGEVKATLPLTDLFSIVFSTDCWVCRGIYPTRRPLSLE